jgi:hypothetical protein
VYRAKSAKVAHLGRAFENEGQSDHCGNLLHILALGGVLKGAFYPEALDHPSHQNQSLKRVYSELPRKKKQIHYHLQRSRGLSVQNVL